jgi:large subunit ribosomal protein L2
MRLKKIKSVSNGTRHQIVLEKNILAKNNKIFKGLFKYYRRSSGRSSSNGRITVWHKGGGNKKLFRTFEKNNKSNNSIILTTMYDPNRNALISVCFDLNRNAFFNVLNTKNTFPGSYLTTHDKLNELKLGFRSKISSMPTGTIIHAINNTENSSIKYAKAAGTSAQLIQKLLNNKSKVRLPSNQVVDISSEAYCTIGITSNPQYNLIRLGKAGKNRKRNIRPTVRGIAMNPVDHPHGGRTNGGRPSVTPWGLPTKSKFYLKKK